MQNTTYTVSLFPPAFSFFWQFNPLIGYFNPTIKFKMNELNLPEIISISTTSKA